MKKLGIIYAPRASASAASLAAAVPMYRVGPEGFKSKAGRRAAEAMTKPFINWGSSVMTHWNDNNANTLNFPFHVQLALSKLTTLTILKEHGIPALEATGEAIVAKGWADQGATVLARKDGLSGGAGINKITNWESHALAQDTDNPDFYTKYWKKTHEYRIHVFKGQIIDVQQKRRRQNWTGNYDPMIRNFDNGWVFCHDNIKGTETELKVMGDSAVAAVSALGLDFGAVDVLARYSEQGVLKKHAVCEINTAPGLEGQTLDKYVTAIRSYLNVV